MLKKCSCVIKHFNGDSDRVISHTKRRRRPALQLLLAASINHTNTKASVKVVTELLTGRLLLKVKSHLSPPHQAAEPTRPPH